MIDRLLKLTMTIVWIACLGGLIWNFSNLLFGIKEKQDIFFFLTAFSISVVTFFGIIIIYESRDIQYPFKEIRPLNKETLRTAISGCILITYLFIFCYFISFKGSNDIGPVTASLLNTFTNMVGVITAFYLGTSAAIQILSNRDSNDGGDKKN